MDYLLGVVDNETAVARNYMPGPQTCQGPSNLWKDQRTMENALSSVSTKEVLISITIYVFNAKLYWFTKVDPKEPSVKEKLLTVVAFT